MGVTNTPNYNLIKPNIYEEFDAWGAHLNANADTLDGIIKTNADAAAVADAKAVAAQGTADQAVADAATAQVAADAAQTTADGKANAIHTHAIGDVTDLQTELDNLNTLKAPLDSPAFTTGATIDGDAVATQPYVQGEIHKPCTWPGDTDYTLTLDDIGRTLVFTGITAARTLTIPHHDTLNFPLGTRINVANWDGAYPLTIVGENGQNIAIGNTGKFDLSTPGSAATLEKLWGTPGEGSSGWLLVGDLS